MHAQTNADRRVCSDCGATAAGIVPAGWLIVPIERYVVSAGVSMVVGERPLCPACRATVEPRRNHSPEGTP